MARRWHVHLVAVWVFSCVSQMSGRCALQSCQSSRDAAEITSLQSFPPVRSGSIAAYSSPHGWIALNRTTAIAEKAHYRLRGLIPWLAPSITLVFPFRDAFQDPHNVKPVFYIRWAETFALPESVGSIPEVRLVKLQKGLTERELRATSGVYSFTWRFHVPAKDSIPVTRKLLDSNTLEICPGVTLGDGEYLILIGRVTVSGFEFAIRCH